MVKGRRRLSLILLLFDSGISGLILIERCQQWLRAGKAWPGFRQVARLGIICLTCLLAFAGPEAARAATIVAVLSEESSIYSETANALEQGLGPTHKLVRYTADRIKTGSADLGDARLIISIGVKASELLAGHYTRLPLLAVLVPRDWYQGSGKARLQEGGRNQVCGLVLDQPYSRQMRLIRAALPGATRVGVLLSKGNADQLSEIESSARNENLSVKGVMMDSDTNLIDSLEKLLAETDVLLTLPDPVVINRNTLQNLLMTTYRYRDPVIAYSQSLVRAGALAGVYSSPAQVGKQSAELAKRFFSSGRLPQFQWPDDFSVSINSYVARSLDIPVPTEQELLRSLE